MATEDVGLAGAIIEGFLAEVGDPDPGADWAFDVLDDLLLGAPRVGWPLLREIVRRAPDAALGDLGAGPLETLLATHGFDMIDAIEREAAGSPRLRTALAGVWRNRIPEPVWRRVRALAGAEGGEDAASDEWEDARDPGVIDVTGAPPTRPGDTSPEQVRRRDALLAAVRDSTPDGFAAWDVPVFVMVDAWCGPGDEGEVSAAEVLAAVTETLAADRAGGLASVELSDVAVVARRELVREGMASLSPGAEASYMVHVSRRHPDQLAPETGEADGGVGPER
jgi:hypothetical protein